MLPKSVSILGQKYKVVKKIPKDHKDKYRENDLFGFFDGFDNFIYVNHNYSPEIVMRSFLHECKHAQQYRSGLMFAGISMEMLEIDAETSSSFIFELIDQLGGWG
jgi:hypothetical protein